MNSELDKIIKKVEKLLNLSKSSNEHEASIALERAQKLMQSYNLTIDDVELSEYDEIYVDDIDLANKIPEFISYFVNVIEKAFSVKALYTTRLIIAKNRSYKRKIVSFIGPSQIAKLAQYTFIVLYRQMMTSRTDFLNEKTNSYTPRGTKIAMGDKFCLGWVLSVSEKVIEFANPKREKLIKTYIDKRYGELNIAKSKDRTSNLSAKDESIAYFSGKDSAIDVNLNIPMQGTESIKIESK